jgi:hypothetical protein
MFILSRLRSAVLAAGLASVFLLQTAPASAQSLEEPGPEELASMSGVGETGAVSAAAPSAAPPSDAPPAFAVVSVGLPRDVLEAAGAYRLYMRQAATVTGGFADGASVAEALKLGAAYEPRQLTRGAVAFAAVAAMHEPRFVEGLRALARDPARRAELVATLPRNPAAAAELAGADFAAGRIAAALGGEGERVRTAGLRVKQAAYDVQKQAWAKGEVTTRPERLALAKALSAQLLSAPATDVAELQLASLGAGRLALPEGAPGAATGPVAARALALAALAVLGEVDAAQVEPLLDDPVCGSCLRMSKLNLFQCLAVAKPWYEDVFCLGQHILIDTGQCIETAASPRVAAITTPQSPSTMSGTHRAHQGGTATTTLAALP